MKRMYLKSLLFLFALSFTPLLAQQSAEGLVQELDSAVYYRADGSYYRKEIRQYNENNKCIGRFYYNWQDGAWLIAEKEELTYDAMGNCTCRASWSWNRGPWKSLISKTERTYDDNGNVTSEVFYWNLNAPDQRLLMTYDTKGNCTSKERYNWKEDEWKEDNRTEWSYDANSMPTMERLYYWQNGEWSLSSQYERTYNDDGNLTRELHYEWMHDNFIVTHEAKYTYDAEGYRTSYESFKCDVNNSNLKPYIKREYTYDSNHNMTSVEYEYSYDQWHESRKEEMGYDADGNWISHVLHEMERGKWVLLSEQKWAYNAYGKMTKNYFYSPIAAYGYNYEYNFDTEGYPSSTIYYEWQGGEWVKSNYTFFYYSLSHTWKYDESEEPAGIINVEADGDDGFTIKDGKLQTSGTTEVYTLNGQLVKRATNGDISDVAHGMYIVKCGARVAKIAL